MDNGTIAHYGESLLSTSDRFHIEWNGSNFVFEFAVTSPIYNPIFNQSFSLLFICYRRYRSNVYSESKEHWYSPLRTYILPQIGLRFLLSSIIWTCISYGSISLATKKQYTRPFFWLCGECLNQVTDRQTKIFAFR